MGYQTRMTRLLPIIALAAALSACDPPTALPFVPPEAGVIPMTDAPPDPPPVDMTIMADADAGPPSPSRPCDLPEELPPAGPITVLGGGEVSFVVWFQPTVEGGNSGALMAQRVELRRSVAAVDPMDAADAGTVDGGGVPPPAEGPSEVMAQAEAARVVRCVSGFSGGLPGGRLPGVAPDQSAWVLLADEYGAWTAVDITGRTPDVALGLYGPLRIARRFGVGADPDTVLFVGRTGADAEAPIGVRAVGGAVGESPGLPRRGFDLPVAVAASGADWVFAFDDGSCLALDDEGGQPTHEIGADALAGVNLWRCGSRAGDVFVGSGSLDANREGLYLARGDGEGGVSLWRAKPGEDRETAVVGFTAPMLAPPGDPPADAGVDASADGGVEAPLDGGAADPEPAQAAFTVLNLLPDGVALRLRAGGQDTVVLVREGGATSLDPGPAPLGALVGPSGTLFTVDFVDGAPVYAPAAPADTQPAAYTVTELACPSRAPERCDDLDRDCDGDPLGGTCCRQPDELPSIFLLGNGQEPTQPFFLGQTGDEHDRMLVSLPGDREIRLVEKRTGITVCEACWPGAMEIRHFAMRDFAAAAVVQLTEGESDACPHAGDGGCRAEASPFEPALDGPVAALATFHIPDDPEENRARFLPIPCAAGDEVLRLAVHRDGLGRFELGLKEGEVPRGTGYFMRVFCHTSWFDLPFDGTPPVEQLYGNLGGAEARVRWIGPPATIEGDFEFLVSQEDGDGEPIIGIWRSRSPTVDDGTTLSVQTPPPDWLAAMSAEDTATPFRGPGEGGVPARVVDGAQLERYEPGVGWRPSPTTRWPIEARLAPDGALAVTAAHLVEPTDENLVDQRVGIFVHDLAAAATGWGRQIETSLTVTYRGYHGLDFLGDPDDGARLIVGAGEVGLMTGKARYGPYTLSCTAPQ